eukprot:4606050-Amphidinium_carterae.1
MSDCLHACGGGGLFVQHLRNGGGPASATGTGITLRGVSAPLDGPPGGIVCGTSMSLNILHCTTVV